MDGEKGSKHKPIQIECNKNHQEEQNSKSLRASANARGGEI